MGSKIKIRREYIIGIIVLLVLIIFVWGISFIKNQSLFFKRPEYIGIYERVNGLLIDNPVLIKGIRVGKVKDLGLCENNHNRVFVRIVLLQDIDIPDNSIMQIVSADLLGSKSVEIELGNSIKFAQYGDTLQTSSAKTLKEEVNMQVLPIKAKAEQLLSSFDTLLTNIKSILNEKTRDNLKNSFESISNTIKNIEETTYNVDTLVKSEKSRMKRILQNIESITNNFKNNNDKLTHIINNFSSISDSIAKANITKTIHDADRAISDFAAIADKINKGKGSVGLLVNNDSLYNNLQSSSDELKKLLEDLRLNPKRYVHISVFGKSGKNKYTPPEKIK
jgi:phospholipid/cholesterol/gamma-HCH transport system substrate-binding protein